MYVKGFLFCCFVFVPAPAVLELQSPRPQAPHNKYTIGGSWAKHLADSSLNFTAVKNAKFSTPVALESPLF